MRSKVEALETREKELRDKLRDVRVELASRYVNLFRVFI